MKASNNFTPAPSPAGHAHANLHHVMGSEIFSESSYPGVLYPSLLSSESDSCEEICLLMRFLVSAIVDIALSALKIFLQGAAPAGMLMKSGLTFHRSWGSRSDTCML
jgi:hypothetical protein